MPKTALSTPSEDQWDLNFRAVQDAKAAIVAAKLEWTEALKERSRLLRPLVRKSHHTPEDEALIHEQDAIVRSLGEAARARVADLEVARERFKKGC